jgi:aryl-alcohol dehydrogenase-like predicted oxidoreductase
MRKLKLGTSDAQVSALCLGLMNFGTRDSKELSYQLLDQYIQAGGSFLDTANCYSWWNPGGKGGESETLLGHYLMDRGNRDKLFIATKVGYTYPPVPTSLKAALIIEECDKSLRRMGIDCIDLYYAHIDDRGTPLEESLGAFDKLHRAGKFRYLGASNLMAWRMEEARAISQASGQIGFCCIQQRFTYLRPNPNADFSLQRPVTTDLLDWCGQRGVTLLAYSPLLGGAYTRPDRSPGPQYASPDSDARLAVLHQVAQELNATPNQVIYAWMLSQASPVIPLLAVGNAKQMKENLDSLNLKLSADQLERLNQAGIAAK